MSRCGPREERGLFCGMWDTRNIAAPPTLTPGRMRAVPNGRDEDEEHRGFSVFSLWPTKRQASFLLVRFASCIPS